jgi:hypothetical protein
VGPVVEMSELGISEVSQMVGGLVVAGEIERVAVVVVAYGD